MQCDVLYETQGNGTVSWAWVSQSPACHWVLFNGMVFHSNEISFFIFSFSFRNVNLTCSMLNVECWMFIYYYSIIHLSKICCYQSESLLSSNDHHWYVWCQVYLFGVYLKDLFIIFNFSFYLLFAFVEKICLKIFQPQNKYLLLLVS